MRNRKLSIRQSPLSNIFTNQKMVAVIIVWNRIIEIDKTRRYK